MKLLYHLIYRGNSSCSRAAIFKLPVKTALGLRRMSDHLERTAHNYRQMGVSNATVISIKNVSPTCKFLTMKVTNPHFHFKAGQWVDFFIPGVEIFTGFSMCSTMKKFQQEGIFDLAVQNSDHAPTMVDFFIPGVATVGGYSMCTSLRLLRTVSQMGLTVKYSEHAPAYWVHTKCKVGVNVGIRVGGDQINYDPSPSDPSWDVLLLAGGIGICPLYCILQHVRDLHRDRVTDPASYRPGRLVLLYSASRMDELIFKESIEAIAGETEDISCKFFVTREKITPTNNISDEQIDLAAIESAVQRLDKGKLRCFICGPPPMIADMETHLEDIGVRQDQVHCEKWW